MKRASLSQLFLFAAVLTVGITPNTAFAEDAPPTKEDGETCYYDNDCSNSCVAGKCVPTPAELTTEQGTLVSEFLEAKASKLYSLSQAKAALKAFLKSKDMEHEFDRLSVYLASMDIVLHPCTDDSTPCYTLAASIYFGFGSTVESATEAWESKQNWSRAKFNANAAKDLEASFLECFPGLTYSVGLAAWRIGTDFAATDPLFICRAKERYPSRGNGVTQYRPFKPTKFAPVDHDHDDLYPRRKEVGEMIDKVVPKAAPAPAAPQKVN